MSTAGNALAYCEHCDHVPCECDTLDVDPRFVKGDIDSERMAAFNPVRWAAAVRDKGPIRLDPVSGALWAYVEGVWVEARDIVRDRLPIITGRYYRRGDCAHVIDRLTAEMKRDAEYIRPDDPNTEYVSLPSGLYQVATGAVVPHNPEIMTTYQLAVDPVFDAPTDEFDTFIASVLHADDHARVLDILAYLLLPGNPHQRAVMFCGSGRNGKGVLLSVLEEIIGTEHAASVSLQEMSARFAVSELYGKPVNIVGDIDGDHITHTGKFKQLTGDDTVRMDVKNAPAFSAKVWAVPVFSANQIPTSADTSHGYLRRWEVVEFPNTFDGTDEHLRDRIRAELPAIAGRLLRRASDHPYRISASDSGRRAHEMFASRSDPVRSWLNETELSGFVERKDVYADYRLWIEDGNGKTALTKSNFYARVAAVLGEASKNEGRFGWRFGE